MQFKGILGRVTVRTVLLAVGVAPLLISCGVAESDNIEIDGQSKETQVAQAPVVPKLIARTLVGGEAVSASGQLFWLDSRNGGRSVYGYDPAGGGEFLVSEGYNGALTSDGKQITWLIPPDSNSDFEVQRYHPVSKKQSTISTVPMSPFVSTQFEGYPSFTADGDTLYYVGGTDPSEQRLRAVDLASGKEQLVTETKIIHDTRGLVAADGLLVWPEVSYYGSPPYMLSHTRLHARETNGTVHIIADKDGTSGSRRK